jgi:hypothetical protein
MPNPSQSVQTGSLPDDSTTGVFLDKCICKDAPRLKDRQQKLEGVKTLIINKLQSTPADAPAGQESWAALQSQIDGYLQAMTMQNLTTFPDTSLFNGNGDPFCGPQTISAGVCLDQDYGVHQAVHEASCQAGNWGWQIQWTDSSMLQEEVASLQREIDAIKETLKHLGCGQQQVHACPQFMIVVQNVTTTSINVPGGLTERSGRSLNNGQGIPVPLVFREDGTFEGFGSGTDSGAAAGAIPSESVRSQFGHTQAISASGTIQPGDCRIQPCQPDVMHLVLVGGPSQQATQAQARGTVNRNIQQTTSTGAARLEFDLPAYVGGSAQKTFFSTPILNSDMTVNLLQADNGTPALPEGSSVLYAQQECKAGPAPASGATGGAGIVIPGSESSIPSKAAQEPPSKSAPGNTIGVVIPGLENGVPPPAIELPHVTLNVDESVQASDTVPPPVPHLVVAVNESVQASDTVPPPAPHLVVLVNESVQTSDAQSPLFSPVVINLNETIHIADTPVPPAMISVNESIHLSDVPTASMVSPKTTRTLEDGPKK